MRENKYRGKCKDTNDWVYGGYFIDGDEHLIITGSNGSLRAISVIPETIGQYTGCKDKNDKEIYEGDITRVYGGEYCQGYYEYDNICIVKWEFCGFDMVVIKKGYGIGWGFCDNSDYVEVVGNIYQNPNLLK